MSEAILGIPSWQQPVDELTTEALIRSLIAGVRTAIPVKVLAVYPGTGSPPLIGRVDLQPLVQWVDATGRLWPLGQALNAPFLRLQAGSSAVVIDPVVGDIGLGVVCDRDISSVLGAAGQPSAPGSARTHSVSDMVYVASLLSAAAVTQYLALSSSGITLLSPNTVTIQGGQINLVGPVTQTNGNVSVQTKLTVPTVDATSDVTVPNGSVNNHVHSDPQGGTTGPMTG